MTAGNMSRFPEGSARAKRHANSAKTKENILDIATQQFSEKGLDGARIDEIAELTSSSKRMIYYYFGSKEELYRSVLERAYNRIRSAEQDAHFQDMPPEQALRTIVGHTFDYHFEHPEFVRLVMNENIHHGDHIGQIKTLKNRNRSVIDSLASIIEKGQDLGKFRKSIDPIDLHTMITALSFYNVSNRHTFLHNFGIDFSAAGIRARRREQTIDCVMRWMRDL